MIAKVILGTMNNARKLVSIVEKIPYDAELCSGRYVVNAKSMLGVLSMPEFEVGELHIHTDEEIECSNILEKLLENGLLADTYDAAKRSLYDITTFGEILIDFTWQGVSDTGQTLFAQNPGGAPANVAVAAEKLGAHTAFIGKAGKDMHGEFLKSVLEKEKVDTKGMLLDENYFTTLAFVSVAENGERSFSFARKPGADTKIEKEEINVDILDKTTLFHVGSLSLTEQPARNTTHYAIRRAKEKGSIISYEELKIKTGRDYPQCNPKFALLDPTYTYSVPKKQMVSGGFDILSHIMEIYFSEPNEDNVSDDISEALMRSAIRNLRAAIQNPQDYTARSNLMWAATMAENRVIKLGKRMDFECHQMEHQLGAYTNCNHGEELAVLHPVYYHHIYKYGLPKFKRFATEVMGVSAEAKTDEEIALAGIEALEDFIVEIGLPVSLQDLGVNENTDLKEIADSCALMPGSYKKMTHEEILGIFKECY